MSFTIRTRPTLRLAMLAAATLLAREALALDWEYEASVGAGHSDNLGRAETDEVDESIATAGFRFSLDQQTRRVAADLVGHFDYFDYLDDTFDSELLGNFIANSRVALVEDRLHWTLRDNFGQVLVDPFAPSAPGNRENVNYLDTGLQATFALGSQTRVNLGGAYALTHYETSPLDSNTVIGELALSRLPSDSTALGVHARVAQVEYDDAPLFNYDQTELYGQYTLNGARTALTASAGYTKIERDDGGSQSGPLLRVSLSRMLTGRSTLRLSAGQEFSNSASAFAAGQGGSVNLDTGAGRQTASPFKHRFGEAAWRATGRRTSLELSAGVRKQTYETEPLLDQTLSSYRMRVSRNLTAALEASLGAGLETGDFEQLEADYDDKLANFALRWQMTRRLGLMFDYDYVKRDQDGAGANYTENRLRLSIAWRHGSPRESLRGPFQAEGQ